MQIPIKYQQRIIIATLFSLSLMLFLWGQAGQEIIGFESRFYLFALEMWHDGISAFPTAYHQPYPDYPVTSTLLIYLTAKGLGGMSKLAAVFPGAVAAAITVSVSYLIGALHSKRCGYFAVFFLLLTITFLKSARSLTLDIYPTMITACCFYLVYSAQVLKNRPKEIVLFLLFIIGFAFRGPIGLVMPTGVVCTFYLLQGNYQKFLMTGLIALILLIVCSVLLLTLAYHVGGSRFMQSVLRMQVLGRIENTYQPVYFYFLNSFASFALSYPLVWLYLGCAFAKKKQVPTVVWKWVGWMMVIIIGMSIPGDKKVRYILPMVPAAALIVAYFFSVESRFTVLRQRLLALLFYFPAIFMLVLEAIYFYGDSHALVFAINYVPVALFLLGLQLTNFLISYHFINQPILKAQSILLLATLSFVLTYVAVIEPIASAFDKARDFVQAVETMRLHHHAALVFYKLNLDGLPIKYRINMSQLETPVFIANEQQIKTFKGPAFFIANVAAFAALPMDVKKTAHIVASDFLGHVKVVVWTNITEKSS